MTESKAKRLKNLLVPGMPLICPGAYDALSAMAIQHAGFQGIQVSGFGVAGAMLGVPDVAILSLTQMVEATRNICRAVDIPVMADGDTGFGNAVNTYHAVKLFEEAGAAGINLEDQVFPKRCGHMDGKMVIDADEMCGKICAAVDARRDPDFIINARTDAGTMYGIDEAIRRGKIYADAGADMIFLEAPKIDQLDDLKRAVKEIGIRCSIGIVQGGKAPILSYNQYCELGLARLSFPVAPVAACLHGLQQAMNHLFANKTFLDDDKDYYVTFKEYTDFIGLPKVREMEKQYIAASEISERYKHFDMKH
jgi:2-methylisocitrate lyase-like PEP mutase family enzyme